MVVCARFHVFQMQGEKKVTKNKTMIFLIVLISLTSLLSGCAGTSTLYSNTFVKPSRPLTEMKVLYLENLLVSTRSKMSDNFAQIGYTDLPELLRERVPIIFGLNNINSDYATFQRKDFGQTEAINTIKWANDNSKNSPVLTIQVVDGTVVSGSRTPHTVNLNMHANLIDTKTNTRQWTGQFRNRFVQPPVGRSGYDKPFVDNLLKTILEQMAKDGFVNLPEGKAAIPILKEEGNK